MEILLSASLLFLLLWICLADIFYRKIPNILVAVIFILAVLQPFFLSLDGGFKLALTENLLPSLAGAAVILIAGYLIFLSGRVGAGDVKLMSVVALWMGLDQQLVFLVATSLAGGVLALALPMIEQTERRVSAPLFWLAGRFPQYLSSPTTFDQNRPQGIPYGVAIAFGALVCLI